MAVWASSSSREFVLTTKAIWVPSGERRGSVTSRYEKKSSGCMPRFMADSADPGGGAAVDRKADAGDERRLVRGQVQRGVGDVPTAAHLVAQRHVGIPAGNELFA